jgi:phosphatidylethanolamine-binding protein (PEBP) family uncharacterized protein
VAALFLVKEAQLFPVRHHRHCHGAASLGRCRSFVVALFDVTASFTHWGMHNIAAGTNSLPAGGGVAGSPCGAQVYNDFYDQSYDGPCPPVGVQPYSHQYVLTVYAVD